VGWVLDAHPIKRTKVAWALGAHTTFKSQTNTTTRSGPKRPRPPSCLKKRVSVIKEKGSPTKAICENEMFPTKRQTQICIFEAQIYSFLFQPSVQTARKYPKSLENKDFSAISCKIVISDKW